MDILLGIFLPFLGTAAGAACVFFLKNELKPQVQKALLGFASGVMVAASVWSLLIPAMDASGDMGKWAFLPAVIGFLLGIGFLLALDRIVPHLHLGGETEGPKSRLARTTMLVFAVTLHNIPEGLAGRSCVCRRAVRRGGHDCCRRVRALHRDRGAKLPGRRHHFPAA